MKLGRLGDVGKEIPVLFENETVYDLNSVTADGEKLRIGSPVARPGKVVCIGLNRRDHAETGATLLSEPVVFFKDPPSVVGANDDDPMSFVAGFATANDVTEREFQLEHGGQWDKGKLWQNETTANMIFSVAEIVRFLSQFMVLYPGDVINTGTPPGVALGPADNPYLSEGDVLELEIDALGRARQLMGQA
jgi:2-keto-4-pentenoate hydratase/2-oxohepta-3-ene-1,7-dioic acid hydratase in catechol pathway